MPTTLLTGANSFVGAHVINSLIAAGHHVIGTVRRENLVDQIYALHPEWKEKLELVVVKDYADESSWNEVFGNYSLDHVRSGPFNPLQERQTLIPSLCVPRSSMSPRRCSTIPPTRITPVIF
jgi:hypothetical protein